MTRWWFEIFFYCHPVPWKSDPIWRPHIFSDGLVRKPPTTRWNFLSHLWKCHGWKQPRRLHNKSLTFSLSARSFFPGAEKCPAFSWNIKGDKKETQENKARWYPQRMVKIIENPNWNEWFGWKTHYFRKHLYNIYNYRWGATQICVMFTPKNWGRWFPQFDEPA